MKKLSSTVESADQARQQAGIPVAYVVQLGVSGGADDMNDPLLFERSAKPFFSQDSTKQCLVTLAQASDVVLYCGAGVTIDRTGLGWKELISLGLRADTEDDSSYVTDEHLAVLNKSLDAQRLASVLRQHFTLKHPSVEDDQRHEIIGNLQRELYRRHTWRGGRLVGNIARYAVFSASVGKQVSIVTTNYDTYIEQEIDKELKRWSNNKKPRPGFQVETAGSSRPARKVKPSDPGLPIIRLIYLHGRIPPEGRALGRVVLDEVDYAETRPVTVDVLTRLLDHSRCASIVVGASLTDPPLIDALALTRRRKQRFALMAIASTDVAGNSAADVPVLLEHLAGRCTRIGLSLLTPDFKTQIAQFFEEATICAGLADPQTYPAVSYGQRLGSWWDDWVAASGNASYIIDTYAELREFTNNLRQDWKLPSETVEDAELFKVELWVRWYPTQRRSLALWGSSLGLLAPRNLLREAKLVLESAQASAKCFTEGRPQYVNLSDVQPPKDQRSDRPYPARWRSFLSVPIYLEAPQRRQVVGIATLASSKTKDESAIRAKDTQQMETLVKNLRTLGTGVLNPLPRSD
ncbi:SIR2 family protein [Kribbella sp. NBC_00382]|uniref:SIR2 family protein n=1 Tax=Kribbella sp. NBC_00382 TaxID=2975967 RepID=UPI002E23AB36